MDEPTRQPVHDAQNPRMKNADTEGVEEGRTEIMEALARLKRKDSLLRRITAVISGAQGQDMYGEVLARKRPGRVLRVLFTSGYTRDIILDKGIEDGKFDFLSKPIHPIDLLNKVREILDR